MEIRHNGALVMRGTEAEVEAWKKGHLDMEGITVEDGKPFELHADGKEHGGFIDSFSSLEEAKSAHERFSTSQGGHEPQFPGAEIRSASDGSVVHPAPAASAAPVLAEPPASEAPTDPAPPAA